MTKSMFTKSMFAVAGLILALFVAPTARAQVVIDVSKITCEQLISWSITDPRNIAYWISGYYNGKRDTTIIDPQIFKDHVDKVTDYCRGNRARTVMQAVEIVIGPAK
jgi:acid stress chaperone HdeB